MLKNISISKRQVKRILSDHCRFVHTIDDSTHYITDSTIDSIAQELIEHENEILYIKK